MSESLQQKFAPQSICFGCGLANEKGLRIESHVQGDRLVAQFSPQKHHQAFENIVNGGIIGSLLDCHCNWTASYTLMQDQGLSQPPCTVTAKYEIKLLAPTPMGTLHLESWVESREGSKVWVCGEIKAGGKVTATCKGLFVAVKPDHPAYHRW